MCVLVCVGAPLCLGILENLPEHLSVANFLPELHV